MCENKKKCSCGCSTKKDLKESKKPVPKLIPVNKPWENKKVLKEGTWAWDDEAMAKAKNILTHLIKETDPNIVLNTLNKFYKKFWNSVGDDDFYDYLDKAKEIIIEKKYTKPRDWFIYIGEALRRLDELIKLKTEPISESVKTDLLKQAKSALDSLYKIYDIYENKKVDNDLLLNLTDSTFKNLNEVITNILK